MKDFITNLLLAVLTVVIPFVARVLIAFIQQKKDSVLASTDNARAQGYIEEIAAAITDAVAATNQTYVDAMKHAGTFDENAQKAAAQKALMLCQAMISEAAQTFIESVYGDFIEYLTNKIEAEVRKQKLTAPVAE